MLDAPTRLLVRDELIGFARSKVMLVLWVALPLLVTLLYFIMPAELGGSGGQGPNLTAFMGLIVSSLAGTVAAVMVSVDMISERNRNVHELFVVRPIRRGAIAWSKFSAVFFCVTLASVISLGLGLLIDQLRGVEQSAESLGSVLRTLGSVSAVVALSTGVGILFGVATRSILVAVILVLYVGQNLAAIPMIPAFMGWKGAPTLITLGISAVLTFALMQISVMLLRRSQY